jgi:hypothetical protein
MFRRIIQIRQNKNVRGLTIVSAKKLVEFLKFFSLIPQILMPVRFQKVYPEGLIFFSGRLFYTDSAGKFRKELATLVPRGHVPPPPPNLKETDKFIQSFPIQMSPAEAYLEDSLRKL